MRIFFLLFSTKNISKPFFKSNYFSTFSKFYVKYYVTDWLLAPPQGISKWLVGFKSIKKRSKYLWCPQNSVSSIIWKCTRREIQLEISFSKNPFQYFLVANQYVFGKIFAILVYYYEIKFLFCFAKQTKVRMNSHWMEYM